MLSIYGEAEQKKQARLTRKGAERQRREQERKREEQRQRHNAEADQPLCLPTVVSAMKKAHSDQDLSTWVPWARAKADWHDPTIEKKTNFLASGNTKRIKKQSVSAQGIPVVKQRYAHLQIWIEW